MPSDATRARDFVQALANGLNVLRAFDPVRPELTISDIAEITGQSRASVRRAVLTLESLGYLARTGRQLRLTAKVHELGTAALQASAPFATRSCK